MTGALLLALIAVATVPAAHVLAGARWTWRMPRTSIILWQALGLAWGIATIGALLGFALVPYGAGITGGLNHLVVRSGNGLGVLHLTALLGGVLICAVLLGMLAAAVLGAARARRRHRALLALVARHGEMGTLVLDHPTAAAYCVPGAFSSKVVVSAGTLALLDQAELAAVLAHERAHVRERHDLVLIPFASLRQVFPGFRLVARCMDSVELLIEMRADDRAKRHRHPRLLAMALLRFAAARPAAAPSGTLAAHNDGGAVMARVNRLLDPAPASRAVQAAIVGAAALLAIVPLVLYTMP